MVSSAQVDTVGAASDRDAVTLYLDARVGVAWAKEAERLLAAGQMTLGEEHILIDQGGVIVKATIAERLLKNHIYPTFGTMPVTAISSAEVRDDLAAQIATEIHRVMLRGSGTAPEQRGVRNTTGVTITELGTGNGTAPTSYDPLLDAMQILRGGNYEPTAFIMAPRTANSFAKLKEASTEAYLVPPPQLADARTLTTNQVPVNLTVGTSTNCSEIYCADWSRLWLGMRTELVITPLVERYAEFGQVAFMCWIRADVQLSQPAAFNVLTGVRP